ncbi:MAG: succinate dehydrogenase, cytochrome b556 subunit [Mariprofundus sp.]|nr:succinate dehydrogenase, cytochrome b556 subunit [Mariprofundus sp.]
MNEQPVKYHRPLSPRISIYRWRAPMLASIAHRASGVALVLFVPLYLWLLHGMTSSPDHYDATLTWLHSLPGKCSLWFVGVALVYHFSNGIRFLLIDVGWGESRKMMRFSALVVLFIAALASLMFAWLLFL